MKKTPSIVAAVFTGALAFSTALVAATPATAASCAGTAGEYGSGSSGYTLSMTNSNSSCWYTRARSYTYLGGGQSNVTYGSWGSSSIAYSSSSGTYSGGDINARYPTKYWRAVPGAGWSWSC